MATVAMQVAVTSALKAVCNNKLNLLVAKAKAVSKVIKTKAASNQIKTKAASSKIKVMHHNQLLSQWVSLILTLMTIFRSNQRQNTEC